MGDERHDRKRATRSRSARLEQQREGSQAESSQGESPEVEIPDPARTRPAKFDDLDRGSYSTNHGFAGDPGVDAPGLHEGSAENAPRAPEAGVRSRRRQPEVDRVPTRAQPVGQDERLRNSVLERLAKQRGLANSPLEVDCREGIVTLRGSVRSEHARGRAEECARDVDGVVRVLNQLGVEATERTRRSGDSGEVP
jgi:hypothetical protein